MIMLAGAEWTSGLHIKRRMYPEVRPGLPGGRARRRQIGLSNPSVIFLAQEIVWNGMLKYDGAEIVVYSASMRDVFIRMVNQFSKTMISEKKVVTHLQQK